MTSTFEVASVGQGNGDLLRLARGRAEEGGLELRREPPAAELDHGVVLRLALGVDEVDDQGVAGLRRALDGRRELRHRLAERLDLGVHRFLRHLHLGPRDLEGRPVGDLGQRLHLDRRREAPLAVRSLGQLEVVLRVRDRAHAVAVRRAPEPAADVAVDRLGVDALLAEARDEHRLRDLALAEAGDLHALREVRHRVVDGVLHLVRRDVDRQPHPILAETLHRRRHPAIQPA